MKKLFIAVLFAALVAPILTSCDRDERKCYKIEYEVKGGSGTVTFEVYQWLSANELDAFIDKLKQANPEGFKLKSKKVTKDYATVEACTLANV